MRRILIFASTVLLVGIFGLLAFGFTRNAYELPSMLVGKAAPEFALDVMSPGAGSGSASPVGETVRLSSRRGEIVILNFWASWCLACVEEHAALSEAADLCRDRGVSFFGVLYQDEPDAARRWLIRMGGQPYPALLDPGSRTAIAYGVYGVPETYVIDFGGIVRHRFVGPSRSRCSARRSMSSSVRTRACASWRAYLARGFASPEHECGSASPSRGI